MTSIVILGAGPAGLAAALDLAEKGVNVTVIEQQKYVGGNASSFEFGDINVDFGSHRLHPASDPVILDKIKHLLGDDLLVRPRHGRIRLMGRWIHFPLRPIDLLLRMHPRFAFGVGIDLVGKVFKRKSQNNTADETFATILQRGLGKTICKEFYFPYARKIWGLEPVELSPIQAKKRVSAGSIGKMLKRLLPGGGKGGASTKGIFYYPRYGFGQICRAYEEAARNAGARFLLDTRVTGIKTGPEGQSVVIESNGGTETLKADQVFSTIPVTVLTRLMDSQPPEDIQQAASSLKFRSMVLAYLQLEQDQFTEFDAHYFPGADLPFTRISEPKNYTDRNDPANRTVLCAEIPCFKDDQIWNMTDAELQSLVKDGLEKAGLPVTANILDVKSIHIPHAYPLYQTGYEKDFNKVDDWVSQVDGVLSFGRQGLYVHDNTHHAIFMAQAAASCLNENGSIDKSAWERARKVFESHVVED